jgi:hypothetical protein
VSFASLLGGVLTLFVFRRGLPRVAWLVGYLVLLWLLVAVITQVRQALEARGQRLVITAADYTIQTLYHGLLLFVLPAYYASTTLSSLNVLFLLGLAGLALLATFDPWYRSLVMPRPWLGYGFFVATSFASLNVALPLVGAPPFEALILSAWLAMLALTPAIHRGDQWPWMRALAVTVVAGIAAMGVAGATCWLVPPAPLSLASATVARDVREAEPVDPLVGPVHVAELRAHGLVAFSAIHAPGGLAQPIEHVWRLRGRVVDVVKLSPVYGGRRLGFRTFSRKSSFPGDPVGRWTVDVVTSSGQLIGRLRFRVTS